MNASPQASTAFATTEGRSASRLSRRALLGSGVTAGLAVSSGVMPGAAVPAHGTGEHSTVPAYRIAIDPGTVHQAIEGFGASGAWWAQNLGTWSSPRRNQVAQLLFSRAQGIGLSQYRYNIGGGIDDTITDPWRTAETFETGPGTYDWDRDAAARWFLRAAKEHGVEDFVAFVNSPPRRLTANGHTVLQRDGVIHIHQWVDAADGVAIADALEKCLDRRARTLLCLELLEGIAPALHNIVIGPGFARYMNKRRSMRIGEVLRDRGILPLRVVDPAHHQHTEAGGREEVPE